MRWYADCNYLQVRVVSAVPGRYDRGNSGVWQAGVVKLLLLHDLSSPCPTHDPVQESRYRCDGTPKWQPQQRRRGRCIRQRPRIHAVNCVTVRPTQCIFMTPAPTTRRSSIHNGMGLDRSYSTDASLTQVVSSGNTSSCSRAGSVFTYWNVSRRGSLSGFTSILRPFDDLLHLRRYVTTAEGLFYRCHVGFKLVERTESHSIFI